MKNKAWKLRTRRIVLGLPQCEVARRVGKSAAWLSLVERGYLHPDEKTQNTLRQVLRAEADQEHSVDLGGER